MKAALVLSSLLMGSLHGFAAENKSEENKSKEPFWKKLDAQVTGSVGEFKVGDYSGDSADIDITARKGNVKVNKLDVTSGKSELKLSGQTELPDDLSQFDLKQADFTVDVDAQNVKEFIARQTNQSLQGDLSVTGTISQQDGLMNGSLTISGSGIQFAGLEISAIEGAVTIERNVVQLQKLGVTLPDGGTLRALGSYDLRAPSHYVGEVHADIQQLAQFESVLRHFGHSTSLAGSLKLDWNGSGQIDPQTHTGRANLVVRDARYGDVTGIAANMDGSYSPQQIVFPNFRVQSSLGAVRADLDWQENVLRVSDLAVRQKDTTVASGSLRLPLDLSKLSNPAELIPSDGAITGDLTSRNLELAKLPGLSADKLRGTLTASLHADGTLAALRASLEVSTRGLHAAAMGQLAPVQLELKVTLADDRLVAKGTLRHPEIQPLSIEGHVPFDVPELLHKGKIDPALPLALSVRLPRSSLAVAKKLSPQIRAIEGRVAAEVSVNGTMNAPQMSGTLSVEMPLLLLQASAAPDVRNARIELRFHDQTLSIEQAAAKLGGGQLRLSGSAQFPDFTRPVLDFSVQGDSILLVRNDTVTARANLALSLAGPLATARLAGSVGITESEFFREVDVLPLKLPGRPAPSLPKGGAAASDVSFTTPPLRDWTFDVAIKTDDPFLIESNLAEGAVVAVLHFGGTGLAPTLEGTAEVQNLVAALPFSRLKITRGFIYFTPGGALLNPRLDLHGVSQVRDYEIDAYIYGSAQNPETLFVSQPPLPQEEILSLLASGATREELTADPNLIAGRATWLFLQKIYHRFFGDGIDTQDSSFLDRIDVNLGGIDPQTGRQSLVSKFKISDDWFIVGLANIGGGVQGRLKYVLRFR